MATKFRCEKCGAKTERLLMSDRDGRFVCLPCVTPELTAAQREHYGVGRKRSKAGEG